MTSNIDPSQPPQGQATTAAVRANFLSAKTEIEDLQNLVGTLTSSIIGSIYPVGSLYISANATMPQPIADLGTWEEYATGRAMVGIDPAQLEFDTLGEIGGAKTHALTEAELATHTHTQNSHNHTQAAHSHTSPAHTHTQAPHDHRLDLQTAMVGGGSGATKVITGLLGPLFSALTTASNDSTAATIETATATNNAATATNQNTGSGTEHNNLSPYIVISVWRRIT